MRIKELEDMLKTYRGEHTVSQKDDELLSAREVEVAKKGN